MKKLVVGLLLVLSIYIGISAQSYIETFQWGLSGDVPLSYDWDQDGKTDIIIFRPSNGLWKALLSTLDFHPGYGVTLNANNPWGLPGDIPFMLDINNDLRTDLVIFRPSNGTWYILCGNAAFGWVYSVTVQWGLNGDIPIIGDYNGDGRKDLTVFRPSNGTWYVNHGFASISGTTSWFNAN